MYIPSFSCVLVLQACFLKQKKKKELQKNYNLLQVGTQLL